MLLTFTMLIASVICPSAPISAAPTVDLNRNAVYAAEEGNIARLASDPNMLQYADASAYYVAGEPGTGISRTGVNAQTPANDNRARILTINDGVKNQAAGTAWNNWGSAYGVAANPVYVVYNFGQPYTIDAMRVEFTSDGDGYSSGTQVPRQAFAEYWDGTAWVRVTDLTRPEGDEQGGAIAATGDEAGNFVNDAAIGGNDSIALANRPNWNKVVFTQPIQTTLLRLCLTQRQLANNNNGIGVSEWEVFGTLNPALAAINTIALDLAELKESISLPGSYANDTVFTWTVSPEDGALKADGTVVRPAIGEADAAGTLTVSAVNGDQTATKTWDYSVLALMSDQTTVERDSAWLDLGDTSEVIANLTLPLSAKYGSTIEWSVDSPYLWTDGTVVRPAMGAPVTAALTATMTNGDATVTKEFTVTIPAFADGRAIADILTEPDGDSLLSTDYHLHVPVRTAPKLPYRVWVIYTDGYAEWRNTQWQWSGSYGSGPAGSDTPADIERQWQATPVGGSYSVQGWVTGDNTTALGYPMTIQCSVVEGDFTMPNVNGVYRNTGAIDTTAANPASFAVPEAKVAKTLPLSKVSLELTEENRLTSNSTRSVKQAATSGEWNVLTYLYNYRRSFGLSVDGYAPRPSGWESPTTKLRGHGAGHYINALALNYVSGAGTDEDRTLILEKMKRFIYETREIQEMSFYPLDWTGKGANETYEDVLAAGKTWADLDVTKWREAADTWPYDETDKAASAPEWPLETLTDVQSSWDDGEYNTDPEWFGYGYINATPPVHLVLNERYGTYSQWVWAPYYGVHKQLAGFMDVYYTFKDFEDPELKDMAYTALEICKDMSHWISNRLTTKAFIGDTRNDIDNPKVAGTSTYGNLNRTWYANISGEYGGVNESMSRCASELPESDPDKQLLIEGAKMFYNKSYWDTLAANSEIMSLNGNSHSNSRIPNFPGVLWQYNNEKDPFYYVIAKNFFDFNAGRFRYYGGNVGDGEWYRAPYTQIANLRSTLNETCCATNLAKLAKDLATYDPDNAEYMDYYERLLYNQLIGSVRQENGAWGVTYQYAIGPNSDKPFGNTNPGSTCCGGTGVENAVRYTDAVYMVSEDTIWVNMMVQTNAVWDAVGYTVSQTCSFPADSSVIKVTPNEGQEQQAFAMKIRIPWWATKDVSVKINGEEVALNYLPSSFVEIPARLWTAEDTVELSMPFQKSIDYAPDKSADLWAGTIFLGPLAMTGTGDWSEQNIEADLSNLVINEPQDFEDSAANTPGNNKNVYTMNLTGEQTNTNAATLQPDYFRDENTTHYFRINLVGAGTGVNRDALYALIDEAKGYIDNYMDFDAASIAVLAEALDQAVIVYQDTSSLQAAVDAQAVLLQEAMDDLVPGEGAKGQLAEQIAVASARKTEQEAYIANPAPGQDFIPWAPFGYARMVAALSAAQAVYDDDAATYGAVMAAYNALYQELNTMRIGNQFEVEDLEAILALLPVAKTTETAGKPQRLVDTLAAAIAHAEEGVRIITEGGSTMSEYPPLLVEATLRTAIEALDNIAVVSGLDAYLSVEPSETAYAPSVVLIASEETSLTVALAEYDATGLLVSVSNKAVTLAAGVEQTVSTDALAKTDGHTYRVFVWDTGAVPLTK